MKVSSVPFKGTKDQEAKLLEVIAKYKGMKGALMPIMQEAQEIYRRSFPMRREFRSKRFTV